MDDSSIQSNSTPSAESSYSLESASVASSNHGHGEKKCAFIFTRNLGGEKFISNEETGSIRSFVVAAPNEDSDADDEESMDSFIVNDSDFEDAEDDEASEDEEVLDDDAVLVDVVVLGVDELEEEASEDEDASAHGNVEARVLRQRDVRINYNFRHLQLQAEMQPSSDENSVDDDDNDDSDLSLAEIEGKNEKVQKLMTDFFNYA